MDVIATLNSTVVSSCFFVLAFAITHPFIYAGPTLMNSMKKLSKTGENQPLSHSQVRYTKANR